MRVADGLDAFAFPDPGAGWPPGPAPHEAEANAGTIHVESQGLLFRGAYLRAGVDLVVSLDGERLVVHDYFTAEHRPKLVAPNGASLSDAVIEALAGPAHGVQVAQAGTPPTSDAGNAIGRVQAVTGTAAAVRNGVSLALHAGDLVYQGDVVQTDRASSLSVSFLDGTVFSVAASARMVLNEMVYQAGASDNHSLFNLVQGSISFVAGQVAKTGDMKVGTPVATMGIRGTAVRTLVEADDGTSRLSVMTEPPSAEHPDGHTGSFGVYDRGDPDRLLATVDDPNQVLVVHPAGSGEAQVESLPKTPEEIAQENRLVRDLFLTQAEAPRLPVYTGPSTGGGTKSSTAPDLILPTPEPQNVPPGLPGVQEPHGSGQDQPQALGPSLGPDPFHGAQGQPGEPPSDPLGAAPPGEALAPGALQPAGTGASEVPLPAAPPPTPAQAVPGAGAATGPLGLSGLTVSVDQDAVLDGGAGVLAGAAPGTEVIAAHAGAEPDSGLDGGAVTLTGAYGTLTLRADGSYVYEADHAEALAEGEHGTDTFTFTARLAGQTASATLTVAVTGLNDPPVLSAAAPVTLARAGGGLDQAAGSLAFADPDLSDTHTAAVDGAPALARSSGAAIPDGLAAALAGAITVGTDEAAHHVDYFFSADDRTFDFLAAGESLTITYDLTVSDGHGGVAHTPLSVTVTGSGTTGGSTTGGSGNQPPVLDGDNGITVKAGGTVMVGTADLHASDPDNSAAQLTYTITQDPHGYFTLGGASTAVTSFTQAQVDAGLVVFHHDGTTAGRVPDQVAYTLSDGTNTVSGLLAVTVAGGGPTTLQDNVVRSVDDQSGDLPIPTEALLFNDTGGAVAVTNVVDQAPSGSSSHYVRSVSASAVTVTGDASTHASGAFTYAAQDSGGASGNAATVYVNVTTGYANPTVFGQGEDDVLVASRYAATTMIGGGGHDVFVFTQDYTGQSGAPTHTITDFAPALDAVDLPYLAGSPASAANIGSYVSVAGTDATGYDLYVRSAAGAAYVDVAHFAAGTVHGGDAITVIWYGHAVQVAAHLPPA